MTKEIVLFTVLLIILVALLIYFRRRESKYLRAKTREALSHTLKEEIEQERQQNLEKKQKFEEAMKKAGGGE
jgi:predicted Holliday junction resolvase-like endonuclease